MKLFYKSYAPDISAGSTTIKDVGKKRSPRKLITLWSFLMALLMMVPVGAMAAGDGTIDNPWTGNINPDPINEAGDYYLEGVTDGAIKINVSGVTLHVAGVNTLKAKIGALAGNLNQAISVGSDNLKIATFTIKQWSGRNNSKVSVLDLNAYGSTAGLQNVALDFHRNNDCSFTIEGSVAVIAHSDGGVGGNAAAVYMSAVNVTLSNGAYFSYDGNYNPSHPASWAVTNVASAGDAAYTQITDKTFGNTCTEMTIQTGSLKNELSQSENYYYGTIGANHFIYPRSNNQTDNLKLFVANTVTEYYGELPATTENVAYPFPIRTDNTGDGIQATVNVGAVNAGSTYYGQLSKANGTTIDLNVTQYPHEGKLSASAGNITLQGSANYKVMKTVSDGFTLKAEGENILTLKDLTINADNKVYIEGNVHLDEINRCRIAPNVIYFKKDATEVPVYFCRISTVDTELMGLETEKIEIEGNTELSQQSGCYGKLYLYATSRIK